MGALMQTLQGAFSSLGSMAGGPGGAGIGSGFSSVPSSMAAPIASALASNPALRGINSSMVTGMSAIAGDPTGISGPPSWETIAMGIMNDPAASPEAKLFAAQMIKGRTNPWVAGVEGLAPLGKALLESRGRGDYGGLAHPAQPNTQQPGPLQFAGSKEPMSPIAVATLIEQLL